MTIQRYLVDPDCLNNHGCLDWTKIKVVRTPEWNSGPDYLDPVRWAGKSRPNQVGPIFGPNIHTG